MTMLYDLLRSLAPLPIPQILVLAGIVFIFLAYFRVRPIVGPQKPVIPTVIGILFIASGIALWVITATLGASPSAASETTPIATEVTEVSVTTPDAAPTLPPSSETASVPTLTTPLPIQTINGISEKDGWDLDPFGGIGDRRLGNDALTISVKGPDHMLASIMGSLSMADFVASVDAQPRSGCTGSYGFMIRFFQEDTWYRAAVRTDRTAYIWSNVKGTYFPINDTQLRPDFDVFAKHHLTVSAIGHDIELSVDDSTIIKINDNDIPRGGIGLVATAAPDCEFVVEFTNFSLSIYNY